jgi:chaperonin GroEL
LAKLAGGVAQINCGATTETEMKERKALLEDARAATQAALQEGIVPGGGVCLIRSGKGLANLDVTGDEKLGADIIANVLEYPLRAIAQNAGLDGAVVVNRVRRAKGKEEGYDADKDSYCDLVEAGVVDPAKVVRTALQNAASVAGLLLTTSSLVTDIPTEEPEGPPAGAWWGSRHGRNGRNGRRHARHGRHGWHGRHGRHDVDSSPHRFTQ